MAPGRREAGPDAWDCSKSSFSFQPRAAICADRICATAPLFGGLRFRQLTRFRNIRRARTGFPLRACTFIFAAMRKTAGVTARRACRTSAGFVQADFETAVNAGIPLKIAG
jgi:hypothetical protein